MLQVYAGYNSVTDGTQLMQPTAEASLEVLPPICYAHQPVSSCTTNFVGVGHGKVRVALEHVHLTKIPSASQGQRQCGGLASGWPALPQRLPGW